MSKISEDLSKAEDDIIKAFRIAQETVNEIRNLPDTNAERIRELSKSYFEIVTNVRNIIIETHGEIRKSGEDFDTAALALSQEQQQVPEFDLESALEALANDNFNSSSSSSSANNSRRRN